MAVGKFMKSSGIAALAAGLALLAMPANAQDRGHGRWSRGGGEATAQSNAGGRHHGGGNWRGNRANDGGGRGFRGERSVARPSVSTPSVQARTAQRNWSRDGSRANQERRRGNDYRSRERAQVQAPAGAQIERRDWSGDRNRWRDRTRSSVDRDAARRHDRTRWGDNESRWNNDSRRWNDDNRRYSHWRGDRRNLSRNWNRDWRRDHRYDWRGHRNAHRDIYRLRPYYAPYRGYSYRRLNAGFRLDTLFFGSRYLIHDPWQYRLPPAYGPYRWVRYYDDALLVDTYSGEVIDVIYDFFW